MAQDVLDEDVVELFTIEEAVDLYTKRIKNPALFPQEKVAVDRYFTDRDGAVLDVGWWRRSCRSPA